MRVAQVLLQGKKAVSKQDTDVDINGNRSLPVAVNLAAIATNATTKAVTASKIKVPSSPTHIDPPMTAANEAAAAVALCIMAVDEILIRPPNLNHVFLVSQERPRIFRSSTLTQ